MFFKELFGSDQIVKLVDSFLQTPTVLMSLLAHWSEDIDERNIACVWVSYPYVT